MKISIINTAVILAAISSSAFADKHVYPGFVAHGINTYNGSPIGDYSKVAPGVGMLNSAQPILEIGALAQEGSFDAEHISPATDRNTPLATTRSFFDFFVPGGDIDTTKVNVTLDKIPTSFFGFTGPEDRVVMGSFEDSATVPSIYHAKYSNAQPTVGEWESIEGVMTVVDKGDGRSYTQITIKNALPNSLYTLWDVGITNPSTPEAGGYAVPFGGLPNAMITDSEGCATKKIEMAYSPARSCEAGSSSCSAYISVFYHWDAQAYGGAPAGTWAKLPTGIYAGNQMVFPTSGDLLQTPPTEFTSKKHGCSK